MKRTLKSTVNRKAKIPYKFEKKHQAYIRSCTESTYNVAEGAIRAGKTVDNVYAFAHELKTTKDRIHLASGSTLATAKIIIGDANGFGLEWIFRGQCRWGKYKDNDCLFVQGPDTGNRIRIIIFAGGSKADSFKKIRGNSYGMWIATEINLHHDTFIKEAFNRTAAADRRKFFWDLNPDNPKAPIYGDYIDKYARLQDEGKLIGGYNYEHFTIRDNATISEERIDAIISQYDKNSIWYNRDILGKRCVAEGLIYRSFADSIHADDGYFVLYEPPKVQNVNIGVDFGGNESGHAFVASGPLPGYSGLVILASEWHDGAVDPDELASLFIQFVLKVINWYGNVDGVYCDSAEQVLIRGLRTAAWKNGLGWLRIHDALKEQINERINFTAKLMAQHRFKVVSGRCGSVTAALCGAVWNPKEVTKNERLDDGTSDIDSLDAMEYSFERDMMWYLR